MTDPVDTLFFTRGPTYGDDATSKGGTMVDQRDFEQVATMEPEPAFPVMHRYGRLSIVAYDGVGSAPAAIGAEDEQSMTELELCGLEAFRRGADTSTSVAHVEPLTPLTGCLTAVPESQIDLTSPTYTAMLADPLSSYLEGTIAVSTVIVSGPGDLRFMGVELPWVYAAVQDGLNIFYRSNPYAGIEFRHESRVVEIDAKPDSKAENPDVVWSRPALTKLGGYGPLPDGAIQYANDLRERKKTKGAYCIFVVKYPMWKDSQGNQRSAYSYPGFPVVIANFNMLVQEGEERLVSTFPHETGHVFGAPDEYGACDCRKKYGYYQTTNENCITCASGEGTPCIMKDLASRLCPRTPSHLGWFSNVAGNPVLVRSSDRGGFSLAAAVPSSYQGIDVTWYNGSVDYANPWSLPDQFGHSLGRVAAVTVIESSFPGANNLELVARVEDQLYFAFSDSKPGSGWHVEPQPFALLATGTPSMIQSRYANPGNFELVTPTLQGGGIRQWRRDNKQGSGNPWREISHFGASLGWVDAVTMIESRFPTWQNLELIARAGQDLYSAWTSPEEPKWTVTRTGISGAAGSPCMIQSHASEPGDFELVYPSRDGGVIHQRRDNSSNAYRWRLIGHIGKFLGQVDAVALSQKRFGIGRPGDLILLALAGHRLHSFHFDFGSSKWFDGGRVI